MKALRYLSVYRKLFLTFFIVIFTSTLLLNIVFYRIFSTQLTDDISRNSQTMLNELDRSATQLFDQVISVGMNMLNHPDIVSLLNSDGTDQLLNFRAGRIISNIQGTYPHVSYIGLLNKEFDMYINTKGIMLENEPDLERLLVVSGDRARMHSNIIPRQVSFFGEEPQMVFSFALYPRFPTDEYVNIALIISIKPYFLQDNRQLYDTNSHRTTLIINDEYLVVSGSHKGLFMNNVSSETWMEVIHSSQEDRGYFIHNIDGENHLVTYLRSPRLDLFFVNMIPINYIVGNIQSLRNHVLFASILVFLLLSVAIFYFLEKKVYHPVNSLVSKAKVLKAKYNILDDVSKNTKDLFDDIDNALGAAYQIDDYFETMKPFISQIHLKSIIMADTDTSFQKSLFYRDLDKELSGAYFHVVILSFDKETIELSNDDDETLTVKNKEKGALLFSVNNIALELVQIFYQCFSTTIDNSIVLLIQMEHENPTSNLYQVLQQIQNDVFKSFGTSISVAIGEVVNAKELINYSYESALKYLEYRFFLGYGCIVDHEVVKDQFGVPGVYPTDIEENILTSIGGKTEKEVNGALQAFFEVLLSMDYSFFKIYTLQMLHSVYWFVSQSVLVPVTQELYNETLNRVTTSKFIQDAEHVVSVFLIECHKAVIKKQTEYMKDNIQMILNDIVNNYSNPDLCLSMYSKHMHYTNSYLGRLFKDNTGKSFNEYLNDYRLTKSKEMLLETNRSVEKISRDVGFAYHAYFSTLFKKKYGMSPSGFRQVSSVATMLNTRNQKNIFNENI